MRTHTCTFHCGDCGRHFHSLEAFDLHRQGEFDGGRYCIHPGNVETKTGRDELTELTGECRIGDPDTVADGVPIWTLARNLTGNPKARA